MDGENEVALQDMGVTRGGVVLRRHKTSNTATQRNVAIIDGTLVSNGNHRESILYSEEQDENYYHINHELDQDTEEDATTTVEDDSNETLQTCKQTILKPYFTFLKLIGWRRFSLHTDIHSSFIRKFLNAFIPLLIMMLWIAGSSAQLLLCFDRNMVSSNGIKCNGTSFLYYRCDKNYFSSVIIPVVLVLSSYIYGLYIFRYVQVEHLSSLTEKVYLGYTDKQGSFSQKRLLLYLRILMLIGIMWLTLSVPLNILRVISLRYTSKDTYFYFLTSHNENDLKELCSQNNVPQPGSLVYRYILIVLSLVGFTLNDLFYIAAVFNYALQCQLIYFLLNVTIERISSSCWKVDHAIKEIKITQDFVKVLNGGLATLLSLVLFIVMRSFVLSTFNFLKVYDYSDNWSIREITGVLNIASWFFLTGFITISAMRLTVSCQKIHKLGIDLRTQPFIYSKVSRLDLDSFLLYTSKITLDARLVHIPMKPVFVMPVLFAIAVIWSILTLY